MSEPKKERKKTIILSFSEDTNILRYTVNKTSTNGENDDIKLIPTTSKNQPKVLSIDLSSSNLISNSSKKPNENVLKEIDIFNNNFAGPSSFSSLSSATGAVRKLSKDLNQNEEDFVCSICLMFIYKFEGVTLKECKHNFCKPCLLDVIRSKLNLLDTKYLVIKCPLTIENCDSILFDSEIRGLLGSDYEPFMLQIKSNYEDALEAEAKRKEAEAQSFLPALLSMTDLGTLPNWQTFECKICFMEIKVGDGIMLQECTHQFCKDCLIEWINIAKEFKVICPFTENNESCKAFLREIEIRDLVSKETFEKHLQKSLKQAVNANDSIFHCPTIDCVGFVEIDENVKSFNCIVCTKLICVSCNASHQGKSCVEHQEDKNPDLKDKRLNQETTDTKTAIDNMIQNGEALFCMQCNTLLTKITGCDYIQCTSCQLGICWVTKKPRHDLQKKNVTIIQGCKCREPTICHPRCGNCH